jgi:hypothetical protein
MEKVRLLRQILGSTPYTPTNLGDLSHDMVTQVYQTFSAIAFSTEIKRGLKEWPFDLLSYYSLFNIPLKTFSLKNLALVCLTLNAFEQRGIFIVPHML